ncbi:uncharacterized protein LOC133180938 [Saccostrea echinata]|uniref:uncharacterized protein LOC133180938 n=1 Tax=Saccostrea echinata TaxID=191078 RepID=UPI002A834349|nr:uncharacterized protein LOC133180938 [Saccostrea echinata]XP_061171390.1 uncharacterized protein LOC133180938 [Saccostrea echinata]XP_061171391.1 uncharacterized protein LOC133180938 [Saccostrea echinata]
MQDPHSLDCDGHFLDSSNSSFMTFDEKLTSHSSTNTATSIGQSTASHSTTQLVSSSDHQNSEGSKRKNKYHWNYFNFYNSPIIPETNEDEDSKVSINGSTEPTIPVAPAPPLVNEVSPVTPTVGTKHKTKPGSSLSAEVTRQQLTGAKLSNLTDLLNSSEVNRYFDSGKLETSPLKKSNSLTDIQGLYDTFRERTASTSSSSASLPPTPHGSPKLPRRAGSLQQLDSVYNSKMEDDAFHSSDLNSLIERDLHEVSTGSRKQTGFSERNKFMESHSFDHNDSKINSRKAESLFQKIQNWSTTSQIKVANKDVNAWAPGGF